MQGNVNRKQNQKLRACQTPSIWAARKRDWNQIYEAANHAQIQLIPRCKKASRRTQNKE